MPTSSTSNSALENLVRRSQTLYTLPSVAMRVLELTSSPRIDIRALKECIENDPALTTRILRVVNSSIFGLSRKVTDLNQALALLGAKPLKLLVLGFSLPKELLSDVEASVLRHYWGHTLVKAVAAREIAERLFGYAGDEVFIAGLLQDLGLLVLVQDLGEPYRQFLQRVVSAKGDLATLELETLGFDHTVLSARLLESWLLPESIVQAIGTAYDSATIALLGQPQQQLAQTLHLAELLTRVVREEVAGVLPQLLELGTRYCQMTSDQLESLVADLDKKVPQLAEILSVPLTGPLQFVRILADAHEQLAGLVTTLSESLYRRDQGQLNTVDWDVKRQFDELLTQPRKATQSAARATRSGEISNSVSSVASGLASHLQNAGRVTTATCSTSVTILGSSNSFDVGFVAKLEAAVADCRGQRCPLTLLMVELDQYNQLSARSGPEVAIKLCEQIRQLLTVLAEDVSSFQQTAEAKFAYTLRGYDRTTGVEFARRCVQSVRSWSTSTVERVGGPMTLSAGVAALYLPSKNFHASDLISAAARCLSGAQLSGGDTVKSIDIY